jgi:hypothetical protein
LEITMKNLHALLSTAAYLVAASAQAQQWDTATLQKSTEMMVPHLLTSTVLGPSKPVPPSAITPMDADDRRAAEFIARTDMMMPQMAQHRPAEDPHALTVAPDMQRSVTQPDEDDRLAAESIRRTDQMRPN